METKKYKARVVSVFAHLFLFCVSIYWTCGFYQWYRESKLLFLFLLIVPLLIMAIVTLMNFIYFILIPVVIITDEKIINMELFSHKRSIDIKDIESIEISYEKIGHLKIFLKNNKIKMFYITDITEKNRNEFLALLKTKLDD